MYAVGGAGSTFEFYQDVMHVTQETYPAHGSTHRWALIGQFKPRAFRQLHEFFWRPSPQTSLLAEFLCTFLCRDIHLTKDIHSLRQCQWPVLSGKHSPAHVDNYIICSKHVVFMKWQSTDIHFKTLCQQVEPSGPVEGKGIYKIRGQTLSRLR